MKKSFLKFLSIVLAALMTLSVLSVMSAAAADDDTDIPECPDDWVREVSLYPGQFAEYSEGRMWFAYTWYGGDSYFAQGEESEDGVLTFYNLHHNLVFVSSIGAPDEDWNNCIHTEDLRAIEDKVFVISGIGEGSQGYDVYKGEWKEKNTIETQCSETSVPEEGFAVNIALNGKVIKTADVTNADTVTVTYPMTTPAKLADGQGKIEYDSDKLTIDSWKFPLINSGLVSNKKVAGTAKFNFTGVDPETNTGVYEFTQGGAFVTAKFNITAGAVGVATINLVIEELDSADTIYFANTMPSDAAASIIASMSDPAVEFYNSAQPTETEPATTEADSAFSVHIALNGEELSCVKTGSDDMFTVRFFMTAPKPLTDGQGQVIYDSDKLAIEAWSFPLITSGIIKNKNIDGTAKFNFTGVDGETGKGIFDFTNGGVFVTINFRIKDGAKGQTVVNLIIDELDSADIAYFTNGIASDPAAASIIASMSEPAIELPSQTQPAETESTQPSETEPTETETADQPVETESATDHAETLPTQTETLTDPVVTQPDVSEPDDNQQDGTIPAETEKEAPTAPAETEPTEIVTEPVETQPAKTDIGSWNIDGLKDKTYTGKTIKQDFDVVSDDGEYAEFKAVYKNNKNVGTATVIITGTGEYTGTITASFTIKKAPNPMKVKTYSKTASIKTLKKKNVTVKNAIVVTKNQGAVSYAKVSKDSSKYLLISKKGDITVKKGTKYKKNTTLKINVRITAKGNSNYLNTSKTVTVKIKLK